MPNQRRNYFIDKDFQTEFILKFCAVVSLGCVIFGIILYAYAGRTLTTSFENSRLVVKSTAAYLLPGLLFGGIAVAFITAIVVSLMVLLMTHRLAGPLYRFEVFVKALGEGELSKDLKIRKKDQLQNLAGTFNKMAHDLRMGFLKVIGVSDRLANLIDKLSDTADKEKLSKEDIKGIVSDLKKDKQELKRALMYFKIT